MIHNLPLLWPGATPRWGTKCGLLVLLQALLVVIQAEQSWRNQSLFAEDSRSIQHRTRRNVKPIIYIGVILVPEDEIIVSAFDSAIEVANQVLSQSEKLRTHQLETVIEFVPDDNVFAATQKACLLFSRGIVALVGPRNPSLTEALLSLANRFGIPYIDTHWDLTPNRQSYSLSMYPKPYSFGMGIYEYIARIRKWKHFTLIQRNPSSLLKFATMLNQFDGRIKIRTWDAGSASSKEMMLAMSMTMERNFIIDIPSKDVREFLVMAYLHNMTGAQYTYFFTDWDVDLLDLQSFKTEGGPDIKAISIMNQAYNWAQPQSFRDPRVNQLIDPKRTAVMNARFALIHDSLLLLAHGLCTVTRTRALLSQTLSCDRPPILWPLGLSLINAMKATPSDVVPCLTGPFRFDLEGLRTLFNLTFLQLTEQGFVRDGFWNVDDRIKMIPRTHVRQYRPALTGTRRILSVATIPDSPFMMSMESDAYGVPLPNPDNWFGYCKDLLDHLALEVGFNYTVHVPKEGTYGSQKNINGTLMYDGMMGDLVRKKVDMAVAALTITYEREKVVDFSTPWMTIGGSILFTRPKSQKPSLFSFLQPLAPKVWLYVVAIYLAVCLCMFLAARLSPYEWKAPHPCEESSDITKNQFTLLNSFYYYISALLNQGVELAPQATSTRLLTGVWWFFGLIIIATYTANLAAFLTVEDMKSPIESVEELANQEKIKYGTLYSGSSRDFFRSSTIPHFKKMGQFMDKYPEYLVKKTSTGIERVRKGGYAFILESSWNEYYAQRDCQLMQVGALLDSKGYGIGFPQGSVWRDPISQAILKLQNSQTLANLKRKWWNEFNISDPCTTQGENNKIPSPLGVEQVGGVFILLLVGFMLGFIVSIAEFMIATRDQKKITRLQRMWRELKFAARCLTTSKRMKSEVHKLPRSRSNIKLVTSIAGNMNVINPKSASQPLQDELPNDMDDRQLASISRQDKFPSTGQSQTYWNKESGGSSGLPVGELNPGLANKSIARRIPLG